jgi:hypothetical protein
MPAKVCLHHSEYCKKIEQNGDEKLTTKWWQQNGNRKSDNVVYHGEIIEKRA